MRDLTILPIKWVNAGLPAQRLLEGLDRRFNNVFWVPSPVDRVMLKVLASTGGGWDHVSVSHPNRIPVWTEMEFVKRAFFHPNEVCMQLHVAVADHINVGDVLHIWRPLGFVLPLPPKGMV